MKSLMLAILVFLTSPSVFSHGQEAPSTLAPSADSQQNAVCKIELIEIDRSKMRQIGIDWEYEGDSFPKHLDGNLKKSFKLGLATLEKSGLAEIGFSLSTIVSSGKTNEFKAVFENREFELKIQPNIDSTSFAAEVFLQVSQSNELVLDSRQRRSLVSSASGQPNHSLIVLDVSKLFTDEPNKNFLLLMTLEQKAKITSLPR